MSKRGNSMRGEWGRWRVLGVSGLMALSLVAVVAIGLAPRAAAHRQTASSQTKLPPVILPTYYDGIETQTVDQSVHPEDPPTPIAWIPTTACASNSAGQVTPPSG